MGLGWGAGGGGGAARTPVQLQDDVDVRVVVHRRGAAAERAFGGDLPSLILSQIARVSKRFDSNFWIKTQLWLVEASRLLVLGPVGAHSRKPDSRKPDLISRCKRDCPLISRAAGRALEPAID